MYSVRKKVLDGLVDSLSTIILQIAVS